jgi:hypothetical protein
MEIGWTDVGSRGYILVSCAHSNTSFYSLGLYWWWWNYNKIKIACCITEWREAWSINCLSENNTHLLYMVWYKIWRYIVCLIIHTGKSLIALTKNERDPPLFTGKLLIKFQNILRNSIQVIIRHRLTILFSVISSPITQERQKWKSSKMKGILLSSLVSCW